MSWGGYVWWKKNVVWDHTDCLGGLLSDEAQHSPTTEEEEVGSNPRRRSRAICGGGIDDDGVERRNHDSDLAVATNDKDDHRNNKNDNDSNYNYMNNTIANVCQDVSSSESMIASAADASFASCDFLPLAAASHDDGGGNNHTMAEEDCDDDPPAFLGPNQDAAVSKPIMSAASFSLNSSSSAITRPQFPCIQFQMTTSATTTTSRDSIGWTIPDPNQRLFWTQLLWHFFSSLPPQLVEEWPSSTKPTINHSLTTTTNNNITTKNDHDSSSRNSITWLKRIPQQETWDCGVACLQMLLHWIRTTTTTNHNNNDNDDDDNNNTMETRRQQEERERLLLEIQTQSIWTIDLVSVLDQYLHQQQSSSSSSSLSFDFFFCSTLLEMNESYGNFSYYQGNFENDQARIQHLFQRLLLRHQTTAAATTSTSFREHDNNTTTSSAPLLPVQFPKAVQTNQLPLQLLEWIVNQPNTVAMVLVDNSYLMQSTNSSSSASTIPTTTTDSSGTTTSAAAAQSYAGHYILLVGTSRDPGHLRQSCRGSWEAQQQQQQQPPLEYCFVVYNPGHHPCIHEEQQEGVMFLAPTLLERAWRALGTDEDVIFVVAAAAAQPTNPET